MNIDTLLFDFDGTLIDTNDLIHASFVHTFQTYGLSFTDEEILQFNGPPIAETFQKINPSLAKEMLQTYREHNIKHHEEYVKLFPNVKETLTELQNRGLALGVVTAKMRKSVELGMEITNISSFFDTIVTVDDVTHSKPHPEPVLKAMRHLQAVKEKTLMVGDNYHDIEAGKNAGVKTVGVSWTIKGVEYLKQFHPNYMIDDMGELLSIIEV